MDEIMLIEPSAEYAEDIMALKNEITEKDADDEDRFAGAIALKMSGSAEEFIRICDLLRDPATCSQTGLAVPSDQYLAVRKSDNRIVGIMDLRHHIDHPVLGTWGGHCGYTVRPSERGKGYGYEMLRLNKEKAKRMGIKKMLVTCNEKNPASEKIIIANGGIYVNTLDVDGDRIKRYEITL